MVQIGFYLDGFPDRGIAFPANGEGGALSPELGAIGRRVWNQALRQHPRWGGTEGFQLRKCVVDEFQYLWWHREVHILRSSIRLESIQMSSIVAVAGFTPAEYAFGAPGGEPLTGSSSSSGGDPILEVIHCWFWQRGLCVRGRDCRCQHDPAHQDPCRLSI